MKRITKSYSELLLLPTFEERFEYLKCCGVVGIETFGSKRYLNQILYRSAEWKNFKRRVILRDDGNDLGCADMPINGWVYVHHINPISVEDILERRSCVFDMNNAISVSFRTHNALHYSNECPRESCPTIRVEGDTCLWR